MLQSIIGSSAVVFQHDQQLKLCDKQWWSSRIGQYRTQFRVMSAFGNYIKALNDAFGTNAKTCMGALQEYLSCIDRTAGDCWLGTDRTRMAGIMWHSVQLMTHTGLDAKCWILHTVCMATLESIIHNPACINTLRNFGTPEHNMAKCPLTSWRLESTNGIFTFMNRWFLVGKL